MFPRPYLLLAALLIVLVIGLLFEPGIAFMMVLALVPFTIITFLTQEQMHRLTQAMIARYVQAKARINR